MAKIEETERMIDVMQAYVDGRADRADNERDDFRNNALKATRP